MQRPDGLPTRTVAMLVFTSAGLVGLGAAGAWIYINELPSTEHNAAWWWFGSVTAATAVVGMVYQVRGWRNGSLAWDEPERKANQAATMKMLRPLLLPIAAVGTVVAYIVSPSFYVILGGLVAGFFIHLPVTLAFRSTKTGRAVRGDRRPQSE